MRTGSGELLAAIGIGSNSVRMLIAEHNAGRVSPVERQEVVTRLASYRRAGGEVLLDEGSMSRTVSTAGRFARLARERGAHVAGIIATEAVRAAANGTEMVETLERVLGLHVIVISGEEEARLGWRAIASGYGPGSALGVIDIGGASTDLSVGTSGTEAPQAVESLKLGSRTLMHSLRLDRPADPAELPAFVESVLDDFGPVMSSLRSPLSHGIVIGGTAPVLAAVLGIPGGNHNWADFEVESDWLETWLYALAPMDLDERAAAGVPSDLADVIVAGGCILLAVLNAWGLSRVAVSQRNILDGFIAGARDQ